MHKRDRISQKFFNQAAITLTVAPSIDEDEFDVINNVELLARLAGAPDGSQITVSRGAGGADTVNLQVKNALFKYPSEYFIINSGGELRFELAVDSIYVREEFQDQGIGVRSVMLSIFQAKELGFHSVTLFAAGSATNRGMFFGYHVWPTLGFDAPLTGQISGKLPQALQGCVRLSDIMRTDEGRDWWYDNGVALELSFELEDDSVSWQLLNEYAEGKGILL
ncbi:MAG: hypothetical protein RR376_11965 [Janthinobacterium sp.]|jgi:GNAT superfamily N-acetyltransferase